MVFVLMLRHKVRTMMLGGLAAEVSFVSGSECRVRRVQSGKLACVAGPRPVLVSVVRPIQGRPCCAKQGCALGFGRALGDARVVYAGAHHVALVCSACSWMAASGACCTWGVLYRMVLQWLASLGSLPSSSWRPLLSSMGSSSWRRTSLGTSVSTT